jgi:hypothetical protein
MGIAIDPAFRQWDEVTHNHFPDDTPNGIDQRRHKRHAGSCRQTPVDSCQTAGWSWLIKTIKSFGADSARRAVIGVADTTQVPCPTRLALLHTLSTPVICHNGYQPPAWCGIRAMLVKAVHATPLQQSNEASARFGQEFVKHLDNFDLRELTDGLSETSKGWQNAMRSLLPEQRHSANQILINIARAAAIELARRDRAERVQEAVSRQSPEWLTEKREIREGARPSSQDEALDTLRDELAAFHWPVPSMDTLKAFAALLPESRVMAIHTALQKDPATKEGDLAARALQLLTPDVQAIMQSGFERDCGAIFDRLHMATERRADGEVARLYARLIEGLNRADTILKHLSPAQKIALSPSRQKTLNQVWTLLSESGQLPQGTDKLKSMGTEEFRNFRYINFYTGFVRENDSAYAAEADRRTTLLRSTAKQRVAAFLGVIATDTANARQIAAGLREVVDATRAYLRARCDLGASAPIGDKLDALVGSLVEEAMNKDLTGDQQAAAARHFPHYCDNVAGALEAAIMDRAFFAAVFHIDGLDLPPGDPFHQRWNTETVELARCFLYRCRGVLGMPIWDDDNPEITLPAQSEDELKSALRSKFGMKFSGNLGTATMALHRPLPMEADPTLSPPAAA